MKLPALLIGDALEVLRTLPDGFVQTCCTSPPYWCLRDYGVDGQIGLEQTPEQYVARLVEVFGEVRRVLRDDGTLWLNLGDSYAAGSMSNPSQSSTLGGGRAPVAATYSLTRAAPAGLKPKDLVGIPWRVAFALQADGWWLRSDIVWAKPNPMPESVTDRPTRAHEYVFLLTKAARYYYDADAIRGQDQGRPAGNKNGFKGQQGGAPFQAKSGGPGGPGWTPNTGRNRRTVWNIATQPYSGAHFACWPEALVELMIAAGSPPGGVVLDPFFGSGTTGQVAERMGRQWVGIELNPEYEPLARARTAQVGIGL